MKEHFEKQLNAIDCRVIVESDLGMGGGQGIYGKCKVGDKYLVFLEHELANTVMQTCTDRDFDSLEYDYNFLRMSGKYPVLQKKPVYHEW